MLKGGLPSLAGVAGLPYNRPKLRITEVRPAEVRAHGRQLHVHIYTDQDITGQGEIMDAAQGNVPLSRLFARILIGQDPLDIEATFERVGMSGVFAGSQAGQYATTLSGVEAALWYIAGKALGLPVYQLFGGKMRDRARVYCDSGECEMIPGAQGSLAHIKQIQDLGLTAAKIDIDDAMDSARFARANWAASNSKIDYALVEISFTRENYPKNSYLAVATHDLYEATPGKGAAKEEIEKFQLLWLEEPVPAENIDATREVCAAASRLFAAVRTSTHRGGSGKFSRSALPISDSQAPSEVSALRRFHPWL